MSRSKRRDLARRLASPEFRRSFKRAEIATGIAFQLRALMDERNWNQRKLAAEARIAAPLISKYLRGYENYSVSTLDKLADAFDVSLAVRFEPYSDLVNYHVDLSPEHILVPSYSKDRALHEMQSDSLLEAAAADQTKPLQLPIEHTATYQQPLLQDPHPNVTRLSERSGTAAKVVSYGAK